MNIEQAREAIYQHFVALWVVGADPRTAYTLDNDPYDPPNAPWVRLTVRHLSRRQISLGQPGNRRFEAAGLAIVQYFEPPNKGMRTLGQHVGRAVEIFEGARIAGTTITFQGAITPRELGIVENGRWNAANLQAQFTYEDIR